MNQPKGLWQRVCERITRAWLRQKSAKRLAGLYLDRDEVFARALSLPERPPVNVDDNDRVLTRTRDDDPLLKALYDHAFTRIEDNMAIVLDPRQTPALRVTYADRAAGLMEWLETVENTRTGLKALARQRMQEQEAQKRKEENAKAKKA